MSFITCYCPDFKATLYIYTPKVAIIDLLPGVKGHHKVEVFSILCVIHVPNNNEI